MYCIGIDLGGTKIAAGIVDYQGKILKADSVKTHRGRYYKEIVKDMANLVSNLIHKYGIKLSDVQYIGIGCPGVINPENGNIVFSGNLDFNNVPMVEEFKKHIDLPVYIENDGNCAALAESYYGAAKGTNSSITLTFGTGIGGGFVIGGKIYSGFNYAGTEFGHITVEMNGESCKCDRKGCWETYASATALIRQAGRAVAKNPDSIINKMVSNDYSKINGKIVFDASDEGDVVAKNVVCQYVTYMAEGITSLVNVLQPEVIVIGGGISRQGDNLLNPLKALVDKSVYVRNGIKSSVLKIAKIGNEAGIVGASMLGRQICTCDVIKVF